MSVIDVERTCAVRFVFRNWRADASGGIHRCPALRRADEQRVRSLVCISSLEWGDARTVVTSLD